MLGSTGQLMTPVLCTATQRQLGMLHDGYPHARVNQLSTMVSPMPTATQKQADLESIMADFPKVFDGVCRVMDGPPCHFVLHDDAVPVKLRGSRPISEPLKLPFREELAAQVAQGIIRKVSPDEVTPWIHGVIVVPKKQGGVRFCPDYRPLNKWLIGAKFDNPTPFQSVRSIPQGMWFFTVVDALKGYHQCALDEKYMALTTFSTPEGLHQYTRLPMSPFLTLATITDVVFTRFSATSPTPRVVWRTSSYTSAHMTSTSNFSASFSARQTNTTFNRKKTTFAENTGVFAGYVVSEHGFCPNPDLTCAI